MLLMSAPAKGHRCFGHRRPHTDILTNRCNFPALTCQVLAQVGVLNSVDESGNGSDAGIYEHVEVLFEELIGIEQQSSRIHAPI